jgi:hypothetical protein
MHKHAIAIKNQNITKRGAKNSPNTHLILDATAIVKSLLNLLLP